ncbi:MAG: rRNA maturation RNase YbeY [Lewinellaceae bacterium]|nr:rRNA maturation RNase YbeY [Saprospiraceae bacterium]MCB9345062.1 rRNA maturation RNase YbeY [Lewinellaceae bacterium]
MEFPLFPEESTEPTVSFYCEDVELELPQEVDLANWLLTIPKTENKSCTEVNFIFCSDERLREINIEYLDHDYFTDVITFPYSEEPVSGDVFISTDRVKENAGDNGVTFEIELCRVMAHGMLHLSGYDDKSPEKKLEMTAREDFYLRSCPVF